MKKMYFLTCWDEEKQKTWSGSVWGIYSALKGFYEVCDIDVEIKAQSFFSRLKKKVVSLFCRTSVDFGCSSVVNMRNRAFQLLPNSSEETYIFQFSELIENARNRKTFIFLDISADAVLDMFRNNRDAFDQSNFVNSKIQFIRKRAEMQNKYFENCSGVFAMGKWLAKYLVEKTGVPAEKVCYVGGGCNVDFSRIDYSQKKGNKILFIGRDFARKGGPLTVEAFKLLKEKYLPNAELYVAGPSKNPYENEKIDGYFYLGDCDKNRLITLLNECDIFCMPSYFEAYGLVFAEALSFGLPCIGRNCYEMPYFIDEGETGYLLHGDNVDYYAEKMNDLLHNDIIKQKVRSKKAWYQNEYCWKTVAERMNDFIEGGARCL